MASSIEEIRSVNILTVDKQVTGIARLAEVDPELSGPLGGKIADHRRQGPRRQDRAAHNASIEHGLLPIEIAIADVPADLTLPCSPVRARPFRA